MVKNLLVCFHHGLHFCVFTVVCLFFLFNARLDLLEKCKIYYYPVHFTYECFDFQYLVVVGNVDNDLVAVNFLDFVGHSVYDCNILTGFYCYSAICQRFP